MWKHVWWSAMQSKIWQALGDEQVENSGLRVSEVLGQADPAGAEQLLKSLARSFLLIESLAQCCHVLLKTIHPGRRSCRDEAVFQPRWLVGKTQWCRRVKHNWRGWKIKNKNATEKCLLKTLFRASHWFRVQSCTQHRKTRTNRLEQNVCKAEEAMVEMCFVCSNIVWCSTCVCVNIIYISSFLAVFLTVFVTRPQQRWSQGEGWPQVPTGVTGSQEQQESPPPPGSQSKPYIPYFMLYTWHASLWCARQTARREVGRGSLASAGGTLWARPKHCELALNIVS